VHDDDDECAPAPTTTGGNANVDDAGVRFRVVIVIDDGKCPMPPDMMASAMASVGLSKTPGKNTIGCQRTFGISACGRNQTHLLSSTMNFLLDRRPRDAGSSGACCDWPDSSDFDSARKPPTAKATATKRRLRHPRRLRPLATVLSSVRSAPARRRSRTLSKMVSSKRL
jgi:hypothetical protein